MRIPVEWLINAYQANLFVAALRYYAKNRFTYIELGDGDELWENRKMEQIAEVHGEVFELLAQFYRKRRLYMIYGNHGEGK